MCLYIYVGTIWNWRSCERHGVRFYWKGCNIVILWRLFDYCMEVWWCVLSSLGLRWVLFCFNCCFDIPVAVPRSWPSRQDLGLRLCSLLSGSKPRSAINSFGQVHTRLQLVSPQVGGGIGPSGLVEVSVSWFRYLSYQKKKWCGGTRQMGILIWCGWSCTNSKQVEC